MLRTLVAAIIFLLVSGFLVWQAILPTPSVPSSKATLLATQLAFEDDKFSENIKQLRNLLSATDPSGTQNSKSWTALNQLTKLRDEALMAGKNPSTQPEIHNAYKEVVIACFLEETEAMALKTKESQRWIFLLFASLSGLTCLFFGFVYWKERNLAQELAQEYATAHQKKSDQTAGKPVFFKTKSLMEQLGLLVADYQDVHQRLQSLKEKQLRLSLEMRDLQRKKAASSDREPLPPNPTPPSGPPSPNTDQTESNQHIALSSSSAQNPQFYFNESSAQNPNLQLIASGANQPALAQNPINNFLTDLNTFSGLHQTAQGQIATIQIEDIDIMHHMYGAQTESVIQCVVKHIVKKLMEHKVDPEELAVGPETVHWALAEDTESSIIETFIMDCYHSEPIYFQGKLVNPPHLSVAVNGSQSSLKRVLAG